jgi:large subunit ribosomal protein L10
MAITKDKKGEIVAKVSAAAKEAKTLVFVNFHGLPVAQTSELRKILRAQNVGYVVAKKTLLRRALADQNYSETMSELPGEIALAYSADQLAPAREIYAFQKKNADFLKIVGGVFDGKYVDAKFVTAIATIPGREVLLGQFLNVINSPIAGLVMALDQIAKQKEVTA